MNGGYLVALDEGILKNIQIALNKISEKDYNKLKPRRDYRISATPLSSASPTMTSPAKRSRNGPKRYVQRRYNESPKFKVGRLFSK